jgi:hypothetical protein
MLRSNNHRPFGPGRSEATIIDALRRDVEVLNNHRPLADDGTCVNHHRRFAS